VIDSGTLARLVALGRAKGHLTNQDLETALPIDTMDAEDIALVVVHLEDAGVAVELDATLSQPSPAMAPPRTLAEIAPRQTEFENARRPTVESAVSVTKGSNLPVGSKAADWSDPRVHKAVLLAAVLMALLACVVFFLGR
jgi:hypothetical protein